MKKLNTYVQGFVKDTIVFSWTAFIIAAEYSEVFTFPYFNTIQSRVLDDVSTDSVISYHTWLMSESIICIVFIFPFL